MSATAELATVDGAKQMQTHRPPDDFAITKIGMDGIELQSMDDLARFAQVVAKSGLAPKSLDTPQKIFVAVQHGMEIGLKPMQAVQSIAVINGNPCLWGDGFLAVVASNPACQGVDEYFEGEGDSLTAHCVCLRAGRATPIHRTFSVADAKKANLWSKQGPWQQYPKRMLQMRARGFACRDAFPDALKGIKLAEEVVDTMAHDRETRQVRTVHPGQTRGDALADQFEHQGDVEVPDATAAADALFDEPSAPDPAPKKRGRPTKAEAESKVIRANITAAAERLDVRDFICLLGEHGIESVEELGTINEPQRLRAILDQMTG